MSTVVFLLVIAAASVGAYFIFFNKVRHAYPEEKLKEIFDSVSDIAKKQPDDFKFVITCKENIINSLSEIKKFYNKKPSLYTQEEIDAVEKMLPEAKAALRSVAEDLENRMRPSLLKAMDAQRNVIEKSKEALNSSDVEEIEGDEEDAEDIKDIMVKSIESAQEKLEEYERELVKIDASIKRYRDI